MICSQCSICLKAPMEVIPRKRKFRSKFGFMCLIFHIIASRRLECDEMMFIIRKTYKMCSLVIYMKAHNI